MHPRFWTSSYTKKSQQHLRALQSSVLACTSLDPLHSTVTRVNPNTTASYSCTTNLRWASNPALAVANRKDGVALEYWLPPKQTSPPFTGCSEGTNARSRCARTAKQRPLKICICNYVQNLSNLAHWFAAMHLAKIHPGSRCIGNILLRMLHGCCMNVS